MAAKKTIVFKCAACGHEEPKWLGRCPGCGEWNSLKEARAQRAEAGPGREAFSVPLPAVEAGGGRRVPSGTAELDRVLGGGVVAGASVLVGGEPGIGKSTLMLSLAAGAAGAGRTLYISGEEGAAQIRARAERIGCLSPAIELFCTNSLDEALAVLEKSRPTLVVVDSIQTLRSDEAGSLSGTPNQVKHCAGELIAWAKAHDAALFLVAHLTKEGLIAGPRAIEHLVDAVLQFESSEGGLRVLRALKNRHGSTEEIGIFRMDESGLSQVDDASRLFIEERPGPLPSGVAIAAVYEGSRVLLVEIQALTVPAKGGLSRVYSDRIDSSRVSRVAAVVEKQTGLRLSDQDIYVNVAGGLRLGEVGIELALAMALYSARSGLALGPGTAVAGELSLAGEARAVKRSRARRKAAQALGYGTFVCPRPLAAEKEAGVQDWKPVATVKEAVAALFGGAAG